MQLTVSKRPRSTKGATNQQRREGQIPAVLYAKGRETESVWIDNAELQKIFRALKPGTLSTLVLEVQGLDRPIRALVKEVQYHKTNYAVLHVDLLELVAGQAIRVNIPVELIGIADCIAVKQGGVVRQVMRQVAVECTPETLPREYQVDVRDLAEVGASRRVKSISFGQGVRSKAAAEDVLAVIAKR